MSAPIPSIYQFSVSETTVFINTTITFFTDFPTGTGLIFYTDDGDDGSAGGDLPTGFQSYPTTMHTAGVRTYKLRVANTDGVFVLSDPIVITVLPLSSALTSQNFFLNLTRSTDPLNNQISVASLPIVDSAAIKDFTLSNRDISANAAISGSKIQAATINNSGVITIDAQEFSGVKTFMNPLIVKQSMTRDVSSTQLQQPIDPIFGYSSTTGNIGYYECVMDYDYDNSSSLNNFLIIQLHVDLVNRSEVSSFFEVTAVGKQPLTAISNTGYTVTADAALTSTVVCYITVTGIHVTTTFFGQTSSTPFVTSRLIKNVGGAANTTNFLIGVGFRNFSAYQIKTVRLADIPPVFYLLNSNTTTNNQVAAQNLFDTITLPN
jgi:hypothetical protein